MNHETLNFVHLKQDIRSIVGLFKPSLESDIANTMNYFNTHPYVHGYKEAFIYIPSLLRF